jgi:CheY-like chemotaxis protein
MDVQMPGMDGVEATRHIRATPGLATLPVIAMTANVMPHQVETYLAAGMDDFVGKPINPAVLLDVVRRWTEPAEPNGVEQRLAIGAR